MTANSNRKQTGRRAGASSGAPVAAAKSAHPTGTPEPAKVDKALAPSVTTGPTPNGPRVDNPDAVAASGANQELNGEATAVGSARGEQPPEADGENAPRTAAVGDVANNGLALDMRENDTVRGDKPGEGILLNGPRAEKGTGTDTPEDPDATKDLPDYPSTTLVRKTPNAAPLEPADVRQAVEPKIGHDLTSTDATAAGAGLRSHAGETGLRLLNRKGEEVQPSDIFDSIESTPYLRVVKEDVVEEFIVHRQKTPLTRLLFAKGQQVPTATAEQFVAAHG